MKRCRERLREIFVTGRESVEIEYYCPIKMERLFTKVMEQSRKSGPTADGYMVGPIVIIDMVEKLLDECVIPQTKKEYLDLCCKFDKSKNRLTFKEF